jgi:hypothetical protein
MDKPIKKLYRKSAELAYKLKITYPTLLKISKSLGIKKEKYAPYSTKEAQQIEEAIHLMNTYTKTQLVSLLIKKK